MKFNQLDLLVDGTTYTLLPYDRGASGAFVYRAAGVHINAHRAIISTSTDDLKSDKYVVQDNVPRVCEVQTGVECSLPTVIGTDIVKTEMRFLASTLSADRLLQIDKHIALLQEMRTTVANREKLYA